MGNQHGYEKPSFEVVDVKGCINSWGSSPTTVIAANGIGAAGEELSLVKSAAIEAVEVFGTIIVTAAGLQEGVQNIRFNSFVDEEGRTAFQLVGDTTPSVTPTSFEVSATLRSDDIGKVGSVRVITSGQAEQVRVKPITDLIGSTRAFSDLDDDEVIGVSSNGLEIDSAFVDGVRKLQRKTRNHNIAAKVIETFVMALTKPMPLNITVVRMKAM